MLDAFWQLMDSPRYYFTNIAKILINVCPITEMMRNQKFFGENLGTIVNLQTLEWHRHPPQDMKIRNAVHL